ncbi:MAG: DUF58 domain-containing protein [Alphaproteobacteria bacterium]|nr:DUF58 domain-containing protein [Alphaproteobacteria bacterium]
MTRSPVSTTSHGTPVNTGVLADIEHDAREVAERLPDLLLDAQRIAQTVAHGIHGRRRAGPGETFWQFRQLQATDSIQMIDWRRSASSDHLYVREREWEAAHTMWLWPDLSPSMGFKSHLSQTTKRDRALLLAMASADLLVRSGERVGLMGLTRPMASRQAASRLAEAIAVNLASPVLADGAPPEAIAGRFSSVLLFSDFLDPLEQIMERLGSIASVGVTGHVVQVLDPAEETLPYQGRAEFLAVEGGERWIGDRVESLREAYQQKLQQHRAELSSFLTRLGWSMTVHHTDRPAAELLLQLIAHLEGNTTNTPQSTSASTFATAGQNQALPRGTS